ncbi:hypothetical protein BD410DRAFT_840493 [Rickenella mellea]|uniref:Uncharacterized protein n=1 Tax=Rickenella mellea TaxID=50990 RepID=A0A4Y7Q415_9AGAM|nr:hypothetical protein BD410DRAFT_840493 [Rickenella mellea]
MQNYHLTFATIIQGLVSVTLITRTYALYGKSRRVLALTCLTFLFALGLGVYMITRVPLAVNIPPGCGVSVDAATGTAYGIAWIGVVVLDTEILILTAWKTFGIIRDWNKLGMVNLGGTRIAHVFLRDGCIYFGILTITNLSQILTLLYCPPPLKGLSTNFVPIMAAIVISRLMLNLREPDTLSNRAELSTSLELGAFKANERTIITTGRIASAVTHTNSTGTFVGGVEDGDHGGGEDRADEMGINNTGGIF